jgi:hypothetical protein
MISLRADKKKDVTVPALDGATGTVFFGSDDETVLPIEVLVASSPKPPTVPEMRSLFKWRRNDRSNLVVIAIETKGRVHLYGPAEDRQPISVEATTAQRVLQAALDDPTPLMARRSLVSFYDNFGSTEMAGIKNKGLFATHHLRDNLPQRKDWKELQSQGQDLAKKRHRDLIRALGFEISTEERNTLILKAGPEKRVVAVLLEDNETFDSPSGRFPSSPVAWGLTVAADNNVPWLIVLKKDQIRLHPGRDGVGVGQKGQAETFLELNLAQIDEQHLALLPLIFSASSLEKDGDVQKILDESSKYAVILGARLRERVYESVVPNISIAVAKKLQSQGFVMDSEGLQKAYSITLKILFRLLFQAYAEDRGLLPAGRNEGYDANSLKTIAKRDIEANPDDFGNVVNIWHDLVQVWDSIDEGNPRWQVPAYNGGLFGRDAELHPEGALIKSLELPDKVLGPALQALLIDLTEDGVRGPVDFRSLSVREFGTIYEGLLESSLSLAEVDLTVDNKDSWVPAKDGDTIMAIAGEPYFHSASGERKATGSYFTPKFVVDHLVERAIDPTIDKHLEKISGYLKAGDQATAGREFFDFRVADLAMGSAHFLVAAVDRIEAKMRSFLSIPENNVPGVIDEIHRLRKAATEALRDDEIAINEIEDPSLLRRQIARRCIYGIDINPMAVELARLAIWIHTFVPGLPMSTLDHNLVCANALTGIGSIDEALDSLIPNRNGQGTFLDDVVFESLDKSKVLLSEAANASEANKAEVVNSAALAQKAKFESQIAKTVFDVAVCARLGIIDAGRIFSKAELLEALSTSDAQEKIEKLKPAHMPYLFPEVFMRPNGGFDVVLGNPPWEKIKIEEHQWWGMRIPGLRALPMAQRDKTLAEFKNQRPDLMAQFETEIEFTNFLRSAVAIGPANKVSSSGDPDLYQAFAWRNWLLTRAGGTNGIVLPRTALSNSGLTAWRDEILSNGNFDGVVIASNNKYWVFENIDTRYAVAFVSISKFHSGKVSFSGPFFSRAEFEANRDSFALVTEDEFRAWSPSLNFPSLPNPESIGIFLKMKEAPALCAQRDDISYDITIDMHASKNRPLFDTAGTRGPKKIPVFSGASFNLWDPNFGAAYGFGDSETIKGFISERILKGVENPRSAYFRMSPSQEYRNLEKPRIAIRAISRALDSRTIVNCLLPPFTVTTHQAHIFVNKKESPVADAYLTGVISSIIFDWYARRLTELSVSLDMLRTSPIPLLDLQSKINLRIIELSVSLFASDERYSKWVDGFDGLMIEAIEAETRPKAFAELDALVAHLYQLSKKEVITIFETFHRGWDYKSRLETVLVFYDEWKDK